MILDILDQAARYEAISPRFGKAFAFLRKFKGDLPVGRLALDGENVYAMIQQYTTRPVAQSKFEAHRKYIDIQFVFAGRETILWAPLAGLENHVSEPYDDQRDVAFYALAHPATPLRVGPGQYAILFPSDVHGPGCEWDGPCEMAKVVVKVKAA